LNENFGRFNFAFHKEKEMVSFRKWILALTVLALFTGLASAQTTPFACSTATGTTPALRSEGFTELGGDIILTCTGGTPVAANTILSQVNVQIFLNTAVTSRLLPVSGVTNNSSEALLLIDEPGSSVTGAPTTQVVCGATGTSAAAVTFSGTTPTFTAANPTTGCVAYAGAPLPSGAGTQGSCTAGTGATCTAVTVNGSPNVFQGIVNGNSVTFFGIPIQPPGTTGQRTLRVTNLRVNASALSSSGGGLTPVSASVSIFGNIGVQVSNASATLGFVQSSLTATAASATNLNQCSSANRAALPVLTFTEGFSTAFKTRVFASSNGNFAGQVSNPSPAQNVPGNVYPSESGLIVQTPSGAQAGLADYGTRLKAVFNNVPSGVRLFVSTTNVNNAALPIAPPANPGGNVANGSAGPSYALLVSSETTVDSGAGGGVFPPAVPSTDVPSVGNTPIVEIPVSNGTATAVWEVINTNPIATEAFKFGVYATYTANVGQNSPPAGTSATVNLSYAPTPTTAFSAAAGSAASSTLTVPRFIADATAARTLFNINGCRTVLLYPYVTNIQGFDTGLAIANTSTDPFGTGAQAGSCALNWFQGANNPAVGNTGNIASGTVFTTLTSTAAPGFNGYMIAVCSFQYAHGFAFVSDLGARNLAMGYLALVIPDPGTGSRNASPPCQGISGCSSTGENISH
jgi:hypothetical protein